jgi:phospholipid/cholesterol/gamma-HCH transport system substrate-binding protein
VHPGARERVLMSGFFRSLARAVAPVLSLAVAACAAASGATAPTTESNRFCAILSDSIGLYVGNPVTQMGYKIGTVDSVTAENADVKVGFTLNEGRPIPAEVKAVIRSTSLLADRSLELVGNYNSGPKLTPSDCISLNRSATPKSLSEVIGSATNFVNAINPDGSSNIADALRGIDEAAKGNGPEAAKLLTTSSALLDNPDQAITDMASITRNLVTLTGMLKANRDPLKQILQVAPLTTPDLVDAAAGAVNVADPLPELVLAASDIETHLGDEIGLTMDSMEDQIRHMTPHANWIASLLNHGPRVINWLSRHVNNHQFNVRYRPPMFRIRTPDGLALCGIMNASMPGSCADVGGMPYAVDVALLQYVLTQAHQ